MTVSDNAIEAKRLGGFIRNLCKGDLTYQKN